MKIHVGNLSEGVHEYRFEIDGGEIGLGPTIAGPIGTEVRLEKTGTQVFLSASISATGTFSCDRCLREFQQELSPAYRMTYVFDASDAGEYDPAEVQVISPSLTVIDITDDVRQTLLLAVPLKVVCREECRGLCPTCGTDLNTGVCCCREEPSDHRWDALNSLRTKN